MIRFIFSILAVMFTLAPALPAQNERALRVETADLGKNIYMLRTRAGGNLALCVGEEGAILIDAEYATLNDLVRKAVAQITDKPVIFVINTHWHFDHVEGNADFAKTGSRIVAHENVRKRMATDQRIGILDHDVPASPPEALPTLVFDEVITLFSGDETITVRHMPHAHTDGDAIVHFQNANVVHTGDLFFNCGYPFIDATNGGNIDGVIAAVEKVLLLCDEKTRIIPGHGPLAKKADLELYLAMLREFRGVIAKEMAAGKDLAALLQEKPTADLDEKWGRIFFSPEQFTEMVFLSLSK
ncbi:MAG: MBL fold metallo-hydrolase [Planctomycetota bacterium]